MIQDLIITYISILSISSLVTICLWGFDIKTFNNFWEYMAYNIVWIKHLIKEVIKQLTSW